MRSITGNPVEGDDFIGREDELTRLRESVESGNHVLLVGPRRIGKSSIIAELARRLTKEGWVAIKVDVQHSADEPAMLHELFEGLRKSGLSFPTLQNVATLIDRFRNVFRNVKVSAGSFSAELTDGHADWESAASSVKGLIGGLGSDRRVLITIDELPIFLTKLQKQDDGLKRVRAILDWLRSVRQMHGSKLPWILCGSIGLDTFVGKHGFEGSINDLSPQPVEAFERPHAIELLKRLGGTACPIQNDLAEAMIDRVGWPVPYYLQLLFTTLKSLPQSKRSANFPDLKDLDEAYQALLGPHYRVHFGHWDSRLGELLDAGDEPKVRLLLTHLSSRPQGQSLDQLRAVFNRNYPLIDATLLDRQLRDLLDFLERDGYLGSSGNSYAFRSFLLRDYWHGRFSE